MPTYDYLCDACGHKFEHFQSISDKLLKKCPKCKKSKLRRLFGTGAAVVFKGSGFYTTDYRSDAYKKAAQADKSAGEPKSSEGKSGDSKGSSSKSSESKPTSKGD
jgi:putative FmdB family regulatory protein